MRPTGEPPAVDKLGEALERFFGFSAFLKGQDEAIRSLLSGRDVVVIMPTGSGKSLCYQLSAMLLRGTSLVISPLIALMQDQVDNLDKRGLSCTFINSTLESRELRYRLARIRQGAYRLVYVAPERFRSERFVEALASITVPLIAVDEAHCISQWGHDFRPDYLRLKNVIRSFPHTKVMALTATATPSVRKDICTQLGLGQHPREAPVEWVYGFSRPNLFLKVTRTASHKEKIHCVTKAIQEHEKGIVYCATRRQAELVHGHLDKVRTPSALYHGGLGDEDRKKIQDRFMHGDLSVAVATNAFGMGVDRSDVRFVLHWDIPGSLEAYYQEVGRAGRDGEDALCELLYNYADVRTQQFFLDGMNPDRRFILDVWNTVCKTCQKEGITKSAAEWAATVGSTKNEMAVRTALHVLEKADLIRREREPQARSYTTYVNASGHEGVLETELMAMAEKRKRDELKLKAMLQYVNTPECRHAHILDYFGEQSEATSCHACSNCRVEEDPNRRPPTETEWPCLQKALSCVVRMKGRYGRGKVTQVLKGARTRSVLDLGLDRSPSYGALSGHSEIYIRHLLDELLRDKSLELTSGTYPTLSITERGRQVMWKKNTPELVWPERKEQTKRTKSRSSIDREMHDDDLSKTHLYLKLRAWRSKIAKQKKVPAYIIMHDHVMRQIAQDKPQTLAALENLNGMGPAKMAQYGDKILDLIDETKGDSN